MGGRWAGPGGDALLVVVAAPAVDGKANAAVVSAVAVAFGVRERDVILLSGFTGRDKTVEITGDDTALSRAAATLLEVVP